MSDSKDSTFLNNKEINSDDTNPNLTKEDRKDEKSNQNENYDEKTVNGVTKREKPDSKSDEDDPKPKKPVNSNELSFLDIVKSMVKEDSNSKDKFNILTNTKEYDCPIAKLAKMKPADGFLNFPKSDNSSTTTEPVTEPVSDTNNKSEEPENKETEIYLEPSISENEKLLQEIKKCKLSVYKNSEWSIPVPVIAHLILNKDSSNKRVVCFQLGTGRLLLNTVLHPSMSFNKLKSKSIIFTGQTLGDDSVFVPHRLMFNDTTVRDEFHELYSK